MINISNFQKLAIFCLLVAVTLVSTAPGDGGASDFEAFIALAKQGVLERTASDGTNFYKQIDLLDIVDDDFKKACLRKFNSILSELQEEAENNKPKYAYYALDDTCKRQISEIEHKISKDKVRKVFNELLKKGDYIQFFLYKKNLNMDDEATKTRFDQFMERNKGVSGQEMELFFSFCDFNKLNRVKKTKGTKRKNRAPAPKRT